VAGHALERDPYRRVGRQDLSTHVDLTELELAGRDAGLVLVGATTQARFLAGLGLGERLVSAQQGARSIAEALETRSAAHWLLDPRGTGGFRVVVLGRQVTSDPPLAGLGGAAANGS
jgi:SAM-dependent MidA family methyltransferase